MVISGVLCRRRLSVYILKSQTFIFYYFFHFVVPSVVTYRQFILYTISNAVLLWLCLAFLCSQSAQADQVVHSFISFFAQVTFAIRWGFLSFGSIYSSYSAWSWAAKITVSFFNLPVLNQCQVLLFAFPAMSFMYCPWSDLPFFFPDIHWIFFISQLCCFVSLSYYSLVSL